MIVNSRAKLSGTPNALPAAQIPVRLYNLSARVIFSVVLNQSIQIQISEARRFPCFAPFSRRAPIFVGRGFEAQVRALFDEKVSRTQARIDINERGRMRIRPGIEIASLTDIGCHRENNEDYYSYWEPESEEQFRRKGRVAIVADGMGGYEGGQEASRIAVETVLEIYSSAEGEPQAALLLGLHAAHERIHDYANMHPELDGMGTTCTAVALSSDRLYFAHVGDSRLYLSRGSRISRLTKDHSYVSRLVDAGLISLAEAEHHPQRHILTAALGTISEAIPQIPETPVLLETGDILVLCTDGLWGLVTDEELHATVTTMRPSEACSDLVEIAKKRGGPDNITVQVLRLDSSAAR